MVKDYIRPDFSQFKITIRSKEVFRYAIVI